MHKYQTKHDVQTSQTASPYRELEQRTTDFAKRIIRLCKILPHNTINNCLIDQVIRSSGSIGANYREANEALSKKDFVHRLRIARKEAKETIHWLELLEEANPSFIDPITSLYAEANELRNILSAIILKAAV